MVATNRGATDPTAMSTEGVGIDRQRHFIVYNRNQTATWTYEKILDVVRSIVFESNSFPTNLFTSLNTQSALRPQEFEYVPSPREWDWLQYHLDDGGGFLKAVLDSKIASTIFYYFCKRHQTTVRTIAVKMNKYDTEVARWVRKFCRAQLLTVGESLNRREKPFRLNMVFKLQHTLLLDLMLEKYKERELQEMLLRGVGGSRIRKAVRKRVHRYRQKSRRW